MFKAENANEVGLCSEQFSFCFILLFSKSVYILSILIRLFIGEIGVSSKLGA